MKIETKKMDEEMLAQGKCFKIILPKGMGDPLYAKDFGATMEMAKEYGKGVQVLDLSKFDEERSNDENGRNRTN